MFINGIHFQEYAKLEYGRLLWRVPVYRERLLNHWKDARHPHAARFAEHESDVCRVLESPDGSDAQWTRNFVNADPVCGLSLKKFRVFGSFF